LAAHEPSSTCAPSAANCKSLTSPARPANHGGATRSAIDYEVQRYYEHYIRPYYTSDICEGWPMGRIAVTLYHNCQWEQKVLQNDGSYVLEQARLVLTITFKVGKNN
jgi:hypothetical protein